MNKPDFSTPTPEPGRIGPRAKAADQAGVLRWLPGIRTLRTYQIA